VSIEWIRAFGFEVANCDLNLYENVYCIFRYCYSLKLAPESPDDYADDGATESAHADDRPISFCDEGIGDAEK